MTEAEDRTRDQEGPQRLSQLSQASLRINESLDFDTVLREVIDSARALTDSRYGVITTLDGSGAPPDFVTAGLSEAEQRGLEDFRPDGLQVYRYLSALQQPLRVDDYASHLTSLRLPDFHPTPIGPFLAAPIRHGNRAVGHISLAREAGGPAFNREDEETLVMFAAQAALVIANARQHREERRARASLETLVETSPVGVIVFDVHERRLASINREARRIVGDLPERDCSWERALSTLSFRRADGRETSLEELTIYEALGDGETVRAEEIEIALPDGRGVSALVNATPIRSDDGEIESFVVTLQDLAPLEESQRLRAEFLGMVSHELRTPLTSIRGSADTLLDEAASLDPAEMRQFHRIIIEQSELMRGLISDLLDVARIETGTLSVSPEPSDLAALADEARQTLLRSGNHHPLELDIEADLPLVLVDRRRVVQVLNNLLANAARHADTASTIGLQARREGLHAVVSVSDQGRGIAAEELPYLFHRYTRAGPERDREPGGEGLGLAICKGIVEAHGGRIWAESEGPEMGARFSFTVPLIEEPAHPGAPDRSRASGRDRTRILAVDDDPVALRFIRSALSQAGYYPIVTADPEEVLRLIEEERPHLVLLDLVLPGSDGVELMRAILASTQLPVIFVSAYGQEDHVTRALDMGAADYVVKPFSPSELAARIRAALRKRAGLGREAQPPPYVRGELRIDYTERVVTLSGRPLELTPTEYAVLFELSAHAGAVLSYDQLLLRVWGVTHSGDAGLARTIVARLRRKLGDSASLPRYIFTESRVGYRMAKAEETEPAASQRADA